MEDTKVKKTLFLVIVLAAISAVAIAQDAQSRGVVAINGGKLTVSMKGPQNNVTVHKGQPPAGKFYDNVGTGGYNCCSGWTVSDGSPIGTEYTPANQIVSLKSGTTKKVLVGVGYVTGTNSAKVDLVKDCSNMPCTDPDGKGKGKLCSGNVKNMPVFGQSSSQMVGINCAVTLKKGKSYWVFVQSPANSWLAWNISNSATGGLIEGTDDAWGTYGSGNPVGAITIK